MTSTAQIECLRNYLRKDFIRELDNPLEPATTDTCGISTRDVNQSTPTQENQCQNVTEMVQIRSD